MKTAQILALVLAASSLSLGGCAAPTEPESSSEVESEEALTSGDKAIVDDFKKAVQGLESGGGEGDPQQLQVITVKPRSGEGMDFATLTKRIAPKIPNLADVMADEEEGKGASYGFITGRPMKEYWQGKLEVDPDADDARAESERVEKWRKVNALSDKHFTKVVNFTMGVTYGDVGQIETGEVAHVLIGKLPSGRLVVIYGIDVWT